MSERIGDSIAREAESETKAFIDGLVDTLSNGEIAGSERTPKTEPRGPKNGSASNEETERGEYVVAFDGDGDGASYRATTQSDAMAKAVDHLIAEHGLIEKLPSFPYTPGKKQTIISTEPKHMDGETMALSRELNNSYYVFTGIGKERKKQYVRRFAEVCGIEVRFDGPW